MLKEGLQDFSIQYCLSYYFSIQCCLSYYFSIQYCLSYYFSIQYCLSYYFSIYSTVCLITSVYSTVCLITSVYGAVCLITVHVILLSVAFSTYNIIVQDGYPVAFVTGSSIRLSIALAIPNGARLLSPGMVPLISGETLLEIILRAATPIYLQTGRPILEVQNYREPQRTQNTGIVVGTIVPLAIVLVICIGILIL